MTDNHTDDFLPQDPADKLRAPSNSPFSLPGDDETPAAGLEVVLVQAEIDAHIFDLKTLEKNSQKKSIQKMVDLGPAAVEPLCAYLKTPRPLGAHDGRRSFGQDPRPAGDPSPESRH